MVLVIKESFRKSVEEQTWGKDRPMVYLDDNGWIVKHWKDGTIEKIKKANGGQVGGQVEK